VSVTRIANGCGAAGDGSLVVKISTEIGLPTRVRGCGKRGRGLGELALERRLPVFQIAQLGLGRHDRVVGSFSQECH
jgi:hypothetical protein